MAGTSFLARILIFIGKPFYILFSYVFLTILIVVYFIGYSTRIFITYLFQLFRAFAKLPSKRKLAPLFLRLKPRGLTLIFLIPSFLYLTLLLAIFYKLPSPQELITRNLEVSTKIYDRKGTLLYKIYKNQNRTLVPLKQIPLQVRLATIAAEDAEFYAHPGFSIKGIARAVVKNAIRGQLSGGSTITQQLVKNALLSPEKTIIRKLREIVLAIMVESAFTKDQILEMYLNEVSYGGTAYGIQEAAHVYFGKDVDKLSLAEAALLAGLPKSPSKFSPFGHQPNLTISRQREVLKLMSINDFINKEQFENAQTEELKFASNKIDIKAPHFVMYIKQILAEKYGEETLEKGGLEITTTLDYGIQRMAEKIVSQEISKLTKLRVSNAAVLVINPSTGEILAMVGSKDYFANDIDGKVNVTTSLRQPGSAIKVINYAYALSHGFTPASLISDSPVSFSVPGQPVYSPRNYDGNYRGTIPLRSALAESRNIPAVKVLASYGVGKMIDLGQKMGITTWNEPARFGLSLTLGGGEIKLIDLAQVYASIANYGERLKLTTILQVKNYKGKTLEAINLPHQGEQVIDSRVAFLLSDILRDNAARTPAFGSNSSLVIANHPEVAVKTGTSNNLRDNFTLGFNQKYLVAVWVGNNDNSPMARVASGITGAAPIFNKIMSHLLAQEESQPWKAPAGLVQIPVCILTGTLSCQGCPTRREWFLEENQPQATCNFEQIAQIKEKGENLEGQIFEPGASTQR